MSRATGDNSESGLIPAPSGRYAAGTSSKNEQTKNLTTVRILKDRFSGESGIACHLLFDKTTGRLSDCRPEFIPSSDDGDWDSPF